MSYILDALRKADAERDRGNVPSIHAQQSFGGAMPNRAAPAGKPWVWLAAGASGALAIGALAWYLTKPAPVAPAAIGVVAPSTPASVAPSAAVAVVPPPVVTAPAPVPVQSPIETPRQRTEPAPAARKPKPAPAATGASAPVDPKGETTADKVYTLAELPDDIRRQLPNITVGGSMYSPRPADRILIINGQVMHEGDRIAPDLVLQQIRLKAAVLSFKGYRYTVSF